MIEMVRARLHPKPWKPWLMDLRSHPVQPSVFSALCTACGEYGATVMTNDYREFARWLRRHRHCGAHQQ